MTPEMLLATAIDPALSLVDPKYRTDAARAMLIAIALQETGLNARRQVLGVGRWWLYPTSPGTGFWQFEKHGGVKGVLTHPVASKFIAPLLVALEYPSKCAVIHEALVHNDDLACLMARALLWTVPAPLPGRDNPAEGWRQYISVWRPGKPHPETWDKHYATAWRAVA